MFNLFRKKSIGLDIADHTIEAVELVKTERGTKIVNLSRLRLEPGIVEKGRIKHEKGLARAVKQVFATAKPNPIIPKKVNFALPESQIYTHVFDLSFHGKTTVKHTLEKRSQLVSEEAKKTIPIKDKDLLFAHAVLGATVVDPENVAIENILVATSREVVLEWQKFFKQLNIEIEFFDIETLATFRGLFIKPPKTAVCIIDIGALTTNVGIFDRNNLRYSYSINTAGDVLTQKIIQELKCKPEQAETLKIDNGISGKNKAVTRIVNETMSSIVANIKESLKYFENKTKKQVSEIILVGGTSQLKGLVDYFAKGFNLPVRIGEPGLVVDKNKSIKSLFYIAAIGLALRTLNKKWEQGHPVIKIVKEQKEIRVKEQEETGTEQEEKQEEQKYVIETQEKYKKLYSRKIMLLVILILGVIAFLLVFRLKSHKQEEQRQELKSVVTQYSQTQSFDLNIPVAVDEKEYANDRVKGRVIENTIKSAGDYNEALSYSRIEAEKKLQKGEILWKDPISLRPEELILPAAFKWLVYTVERANNLLVQEVDKLNKNNIEYALNNIVKIDLKPTDNKDIFYLTGRVTISLNQLIQIPEEQDQEAEEIVAVEEEEVIQEEIQQAQPEMIMVQETDIGWLNVRSGPGTSYSRIGKVYPGETYPLLQEQEKWYKIKFNEETQGWVFSEYTIKQK